MSQTKVEIILEALKKGKGVEEQAKAIEALTTAAQTNQKVITELTEAESKLSDEQKDLSKQAKQKIQEAEEYNELLEAKAEVLVAAVEHDEQLADSTEKVTDAADDAKQATDKLGNAQEEQGNETRKSAKSLDELEKELIQARRQYHEAEIGTEKFAQAQKEVTRIERERAVVMRQGQKATRHSGLAVLEFSRLVEDAQYGLRGIQNNIPVLLTMLGAGAGLAGVISLVVVGLGLLIPLLKQEAEFTEKVAEASARVAAAKVEEAQQDRASATAKKEAQIEYENYLTREKERLKEQVAAVDELAEARRRERDVQQAIDDSQLALDLEKIDADKSLSSGEKVSQSAAARQAADERRAEREKQQREDNFKAAQKKIELAEEEIEQGKQAVDKGKELRASAGELTDANIALKSEIKKQEAYLSAKLIPSLEKRLANDARSKYLDFSAKPKRSDFESDEEFVEVVRLLAEEQVYVYANTLKYLESIDQFNGVISDLQQEYEDRAENIRQKDLLANRLNNEGNARQQTAQNNIEAANKEQQKIQTETKIIEATQPIEAQRQQIQTNRAKAEAAQQDALREANEFTAEIPKIFEKMGRDAEQTRLAVERAQQFSGILSTAFADGIYSDEEQKQFKAAVDEWKREFKIFSNLQIQSFGEMIAEVSLVKQQLNSVQQSVQTLQSSRPINN